MKEIDVAELAKKLKSGGHSHIVIDVRSPEERTEGRIQGTVNIPLSRIREQVDMLRQYDAVYVHCNSGGRSHRVCDELSQLGLENVVNVKGGMLEWAKAGHPVIKSNKYSINRQVRLIAGILVVAGILLAHFVHPYFLLISLFVGCGLTFAGLTGKCGMAAVLLYMPWNRVK